MLAVRASRNSACDALDEQRDRERDRRDEPAPLHEHEREQDAERHEQQDVRRDLDHVVAEPRHRRRDRAQQSSGAAVDRDGPERDRGERDRVEREQPPGIAAVAALRWTRPAASVRSTRSIAWGLPRSGAATLPRVWIRVYSRRLAPADSASARAGRDYGGRVSESRVDAATRRSRRARPRVGADDGRGPRHPHTAHQRPGASSSRSARRADLVRHRRARRPGAASPSSATRSSRPAGTSARATSSATARRCTPRPS